jgi:chromosome segregation ATPase
MIWTLRKKEKAMETINQQQACEPEAKSPLEEIYQRITEAEASKSATREALTAAESELGDLKGERLRLLLEIADGNADANIRVDGIDRDLIALERRVEGLKAKIALLDSQLKNLRDEARPLQLEKIDQERRERAAEYREQALKAAHEQFAHWRAGCRAAYELRDVLAKTQVDGLLTDGDRGAIIGEIAELFRVERAAALNHPWRLHTASVGGWQLTIAAAMPPED